VRVRVRFGIASAGSAYEHPLTGPAENAEHLRRAFARHMQGFLGSDGLPPTALLAAGRDEVTGYGGYLISGTVTAITPC